MTCKLTLPDLLKNCVNSSEFNSIITWAEPEIFLGGLKIIFGLEPLVSPQLHKSIGQLLYKRHIGGWPGGL